MYHESQNKQSFYPQPSYEPTGQIDQKTSSNPRLDLSQEIVEKLVTQKLEEYKNDMMSRAKKEMMVPGSGTPFEYDVIKDAGKCVSRVVKPGAVASSFFSITPQGIRGVLTNNHVFAEKDLIPSAGANGGHEEMKFTIGQQRITFTSEKLDVTFIQIFPQDYQGVKIEFAPMAPKYCDKGTQIGVMQHFGGEKLSFGQGLVVRRNGSNIVHSASTKPGSSGSMVINNEGSVVGVHSAGLPDEQLNLATAITDVLQAMDHLLKGAASSYTPQASPSYAPPATTTSHHHHHKDKDKQKSSSNVVVKPSTPTPTPTKPSSSSSSSSSAVFGIPVTSSSSSSTTSYPGVGLGGGNTNYQEPLSYGATPPPSSSSTSPSSYSSSSQYGKEPYSGYSAPPGNYGGGGYGGGYSGGYSEGYPGAPSGGYYNNGPPPNNYYQGGYDNSYNGGNYQQGYGYNNNPYPNRESKEVPIDEKDEIKDDFNPDMEFLKPLSFACELPPSSSTSPNQNNVPSYSADAPPAYPQPSYAQPPPYGNPPQQQYGYPTPPQQRYY